MNDKTLYKYFIFSDVHGEYDALSTALREAGYDSTNKTHKLVSLGDDFDRGPSSKQVYSLLMNTNPKRLISVKGNHDCMFQEYLEKGMDGEFVLFNILHNGLGETIKSFTGMPDKMFSPSALDDAKKHINLGVLNWLKSKPLYYETENFIFTHAGIDPSLQDWRQTDEHHLLWDIENSHKPCFNTNKIVVIGHHHAAKVRANAKDEGLDEMDIDKARYYSATDGKQRSMAAFGNTDENRIFMTGNKIAIDGLTNLTHKVNVLVVEDYEIPTETEHEKVPEPQHTDDGNIRIASSSYNGMDGTFVYTINNPGVAGNYGYVYTDNNVRW